MAKSLQSIDLSNDRQRPRRTKNLGELDLFVGPDYVITLPNNDLEPIDSLFARCWESEEVREGYFEKGAPFLLYKIVDHAVDASFPMLRKMGQKMERIEDDIFEGKSDLIVRDISNAKQEIITFRRIDAFTFGTRVSPKSACTKIEIDIPGFIKKFTSRGAAGSPGYWRETMRPAGEGQRPPSSGAPSELMYTARNGLLPYAASPAAAIAAAISSAPSGDAGMKMAVLTNKPERFSRRIVAGLGFEDLDDRPVVTGLGQQLRSPVHVVGAEHDVDMALGLADQVAVLHQGRLILDDKPEAVRQNPEVREVYFGNI